MVKKTTNQQNNELLQMQKNTEDSLLMVNRLLQEEIKQKTENFMKSNKTLSNMFNFLKPSTSAEASTSSKDLKPS